MRYSLLNFIQCLSCAGELKCLVPGQKMNREDDAVEIKEGLLYCSKCHYWFPLRDFIPELLPDHLRNWEADQAFLESMKKKLPAGIFKELWEKSQQAAGQVSSSAVEDKGIHFKKSEISIKTKIADPHFFGPGNSAPFNPGNTEFTMHLLRRFANILPLLDVNQGDVVLDTGVGYAWTTEWFMNMGIDPIGLDICRTYLDIGVQRIQRMQRPGSGLPHLVIGDVENLPLKEQTVNGILCYDAFHHIPNRKKAMAHFYRALKEPGNIVLAEPGGTHEYAAVSREVMDKYGILEKGMELGDVNGYCEGLSMMPPEQHFILNILEKEKNKTLSSDFILSHTHVDCNVFVVKKRAGKTDQVIRISKYTKIKRKVKQRIKRLLKWLFIKLFY